MEPSLTIDASDFAISPAYKHKLQRIMRQESFKVEHRLQFGTLTKREVEIIELLTNDFNNPEIANMLSISRYTVEQHRKNINRKLGINSTVQLMNYALAFDIV